MEYALTAALILFLAYLFFETRKKSRRVLLAVAQEKKEIAEDSGMTAVLGVFSPDLQTTVIIGASEEKGLFYYRMLKQTKVINKSRINMANLARIDFMINGKPHEISENSEQLTLSLRATEIADATISSFTSDALRTVQKAALRIVFYGDGGAEKTLEITAYRHNDEKQKFERVQLLKSAAWWTAYLRMCSRKTRQIRSSLEPENIE
ncbi:MAG: thioredoxin [Desulfovibrio sp.]|nr:thioredoxin [Desulfovibrio sp.]